MLAKDFLMTLNQPFRYRDTWVVRCGIILIVLALVTACSRREVTSTAPPASRTHTEARPSSARLESIAFTIQVGAFSTSERAARYADQLDARGLDAYYFVDGDRLWKVRFGRFSSKSAATRRAAGLKGKGIIDAYYIISLSRVSEDALRGNLVATAKRFIGTPYRWGGTSQVSGFDCSGLTMTVYRLNGMELPRTASAQYASGSSISRQALEPGDLVFFRTGSSRRISHVGVYSGKGRFIHAPGRGKRIRTASLSTGYFTSRYAGARRYF